MADQVTQVQPSGNGEASGIGNGIIIGIVIVILLIVLAFFFFPGIRNRGTTTPLPTTTSGNNNNVVPTNPASSGVPGQYNSNIQGQTPQGTPQGQY